MTAPERRGPERPGPDYPPEWDHEPAEVDDDGSVLWQLAHHGTDPDWYDATESCGGCGNADCHPGKPCIGDMCHLCPTRKAAGQVPW